MEPEPVIESLRNAVAAMPDDVPLRLHLASLLLRAGQRDEAVRHLGAVLQRDPGNGDALAMLTAPAGTAGQQPSAQPGSSVSPERTVASDLDSPSSATVPDAADGADGNGSREPAPSGEAGGPGAGGPGAGGTGAGGPPAGGSPSGGERAGDVTASYDWSQAEDELRDVLPSMFLGDAGSTSAGLDEARAYDAEHTGLTLADVAGMTEVKKRLEAAFLAPMRNPSCASCTGNHCAAGCCSTGRRGAARRSSPARWPANSAPGSSPCRSPT